MDEEKDRFEKNMERIRAERRKKEAPPSYEDSQRMEASKQKSIKKVP